MGLVIARETVFRSRASSGGGPDGVCRPAVEESVREFDLMVRCHWVREAHAGRREEDARDRGSIAAIVAVVSVEVDCSGSGKAESKCYTEFLPMV